VHFVIVITSMWNRLVDLVQNRVEVLGYRRIALQLQDGLSEFSILEGARGFSHVRNVFTRSVTHAALCSGGTERFFSWSKVAGA
jgi:hypothetical protein